MIWNTLLDPALSGRLCLTLLHSLWQVALLAGLLWLVERCWQKITVERRYVLHVAVLLCVLLALPVTFLLVGPAASTPVVISQPQTVRDTFPSQAETKPAAPPQFRSEMPELLPGAESPLSENQKLQPASNISPEKTKTSPARRSQAWLWLAPWIVACYVAGVVLMLARLVISSIRVQRLAASAERIIAGPLVNSLREIARKWSLKAVPVLARSEQIIVPRVTGILRPMILLPASAISGLTTDELELILAHELAHIRRFDLWINLLQRFTEAILFFNPALWYLSHRISMLREYCCDEMTCQLKLDSTSPFESRVNYATALLHVAELARRSSVSTGDLTSLAASGRSPSEIRRRVARLFGESLQEPMPVSRNGLCALLLLGFSLTLITMVSPSNAEPASQKTAIKAETEAQQKNQPVTDDTDTQDHSLRQFQLNVVDPDGKPVPDTTVEIRSDPAPTAEHILRGEYLRDATYGPFVKTNDKGELLFRIPLQMKRFNLSIKKPGYAPYWAGWSSYEHPESIPAEFTAILDKGWTVGGVIVDEAGKPVEGARISPSVYFKKRPGDTSQLGVGTKIKTDAKGQWHFDYVPASKAEVHIDVNHPDYRPWRKRVARSEFEVKADASPSARITLEEGLNITGSVTDENGKPIAGALVRTKFGNDVRKATTDEFGVYLITGCEPRVTRVVVSAKGRAPDVQEVRVEPDMIPVDFSLKPGGKVRVRVVDKNGKGIPKARIFFQTWRRWWVDNFEFDYVNQYANENGVWEWDEAPLDSFKVDICRPGGMQLTNQTLLAREEEYVFQPPKALVISGSVVDAKTKQPVKRFRVTPGVQRDDSTSSLFWNTSESFESSDGKYSIRIHRDDPAHFLRIEADGFEVATSRAFKPDEESVPYDFALKPAKDIAATILTATGKPAANAQIAVGIVGSQIMIKNGRIRNISTYATRLQSDDMGQFSIPPRTEPFQLIILHPDGFAHLKSETGPIPDPVKLTPWARLEGTFRVGKDIAPHVDLTLFGNGFNLYGDKEPHIHTETNTKTDENGRFVFNRVFPGKCRVGREITMIVNEGTSEVTSSHREKVELFAGKTTTLNLGGTGRRIIGQLVPADGYSGRVIWNLNLIRLEGALEPPPAPPVPEKIKQNAALLQLWYAEWFKTEAGKAWRIAHEKYLQLQADNTYFSASIGDDGAFHIDDVPPGNYDLKMWLHDNPAGRLKPVSITVPASDEKNTTEPIDLGTLTLEK
ncbi:carboxypeptidase regulatory-like domain-containing protein [Gimesia sp.]|uniref:M56 family metallopeptidase n=1 Tax=Gimesia sp. TaxID=2024833 RepID=UPI000C529EAE|nr:carboxypeptidase regulatory-like domain-containing protein [Gimesia sp.]MAX38559.1 hypothetical protein [Gimesia sp.]HBL44464.1 hypothetical protein [Planctomycetaceae bacterium]|tara:strand:- start:2020 stop:5709 length:3690 start_codon:yes stop_codon:yes gene_type:complete